MSDNLDQSERKEILLPSLLTESYLDICEEAWVDTLRDREETRELENVRQEILHEDAYFDTVDN
jgi:hypothetical protein